MRDRHALALDVRGTHRRRVQEEVDEVVVEQIDLVDIEDAAVCGGEQAGFEGFDTLGERALDVQGAHQAVLTRADRQLHEACGALGGDGAVGVGPVGAPGVRGGGVAGEPAAVDDVEVGQERGEGAHDGGFRGALLTSDQHTADRRGDGVDQQRQFQVVHADDRAEGVASRSAHAGQSFLGSPRP